MKNAIIVDIDGTAANTNHRQHHISGEKKNWKAFNDECVNDKPNEWCIQLIRSLVACYGVRPIFITGRSMEYYHVTVAWLKEYTNLEGFDLLMREEKNYEKDTELKKRLYETHVKGHYEKILFAIEDRKQVADMWRKEGLVCLHCDEGDF
jgi:hypothetical protein